MADAWNASVPAKYRIDASLVEANLLGHSLLLEEASFWSEGAFIAVKRNAADLYDGPDPKVAHLALLGGGKSGPTGLELPLRIVTETLREEGYEAIVIGQDSGHFLPGAPTDVPWLGSFLKANGFEPGDLAFDLESDLIDLPHSVSPRGYEFRTIGVDDLEALDAFLAREFPRRWRYDVMRKVEVEGPSTVFALLSEGRCQGFALLQGENCALPIGGAVWRASLGPRWGALGPIGISKAIRGEGLGRTLLNRALVALRDQGARRTIIDWTGLVDFYGTQGFSVTRAYRSYRLSLRPGPESAA